jgi:hypothetical protein
LLQQCLRVGDDVSGNPRPMRKDQVAVAAGGLVVDAVAAPGSAPTGLPRGLRSMDLVFPASEVPVGGGRYRWLLWPLLRCLSHDIPPLQDNRCIPT